MTRAPGPRRLTVADVHGGAYPEAKYLVAIDPAELDAFPEALALQGD